MMELVKLLEHEAKKILADYDVPVPRGELVSADDVPFLPCVLKVQVPVGGRGKAGGIRIIHTEAEFAAVMQELPDITVDGHHPSSIYAEQLLAVARELYVSLTINRERGVIELTAHPEGGIDIESHEPESFYRQTITKPAIDNISQALADHLAAPEVAFALADMIERLYDCLLGSDATLLEINPLVITADSQLIAADCKMELDDAAVFRHPEWDFVDSLADTNFVPLNPNGSVATIANGAGLAMATVDAVAVAGHQPANFLDIGGGATTESVVASFEKIMEFASVEVIVINIFGGIVRCDTVAQAIVEARAKIDNLPRLVVRLSGNRADEARDILESDSLVLHDNLEQALEAI